MDLWAKILNNFLFLDAKLSTWYFQKCWAISFFFQPHLQHILLEIPKLKYSVAPQLREVGGFNHMNVLLCIYFYIYSIFKRYVYMYVGTWVSLDICLLFQHSCFLKVLLLVLHFCLSVDKQLVLWALTHRMRMSFGSQSQASTLQDSLCFSNYQQTLSKLIYVQWVLWPQSPWSSRIKSAIQFLAHFWLVFSFRDLRACWWYKTHFWFSRL